MQPAQTRQVHCNYPLVSNGNTQWEMWKNGVKYNMTKVQIVIFMQGRNMRSHKIRTYPACCKQHGCVQNASWIVHLLLKAMHHCVWEPWIQGQSVRLWLIFVFNSWTVSIQQKIVLVREAPSKNKSQLFGHCPNSDSTPSPSVIPRNTWIPILGGTWAMRIVSVTL